MCWRVVVVLLLLLLLLLQVVGDRYADMAATSYHYSRVKAQQAAA